MSLITYLFFSVIGWLLLYGAYSAIMVFIDGKWADKVLAKRQKEIDAADALGD